eukprot:GFYU01006179.1.p1 GENE.GFYU01006179.1~~GFYU01006179.1.p1  ORF type:complete len:100 (-),score=32.00 GFYU01006179.1:457-756(-)
MSAARRLIPLFDRVLVQRIEAQTKTAAGIYLPDSAVSKVNEGKVVAVGEGARNRDGNVVAPTLKEGNTVLLPEYGGNTVKLNDTEYVLYREEDILGVLN